MSVHVLYVISSLAVSGGAEQSLAAMAPWLVKHGVVLSVAHLEDDAGLQDRLLAAGAQVFRASGGRAARVASLARIVRSLRPDLVHTTLYEADQAGRAAALVTRVPSVTSLVNATYGPEHLGDPKLRRWKVRAAQVVDVGTARVTRRFHANSVHVADLMARRLLVPRSRIEVIPRGRDPEVLGTRTEERRREVRSRLGLTTGTPVVLAAARHEHQKGLDVLVEATAAVARAAPDVAVLVAGREGNQTASLRAASARLGLDRSIRFLGARADVPDLLAAADVFVLPTRWEGLPGVLIEALALETPIVASDIPPVREVVGGGGDEALARLVRPERPELLAEAILATLADPGAPERARRGRERFLRSFCIGATTERMVEFYDRALRRPAA